MPATQHPVPRSLGLEYLDVLVLSGVLGVATWVIHKKRSRRWVVGLTAFTLLYFGFYREGCVCAIGSVQNVALGLFQNGYVLPLGVLAFFALPLTTALFFGRTFCAAACPHGALQDLILVKPVKVPAWLERGLGVIPFVYLGLAALFAATGSAFIICQYDPFIPIFRLSGSTSSLAIGVGYGICFAPRCRGNDTISSRSVPPVLAARAASSSARKSRCASAEWERRSLRRGSLRLWRRIPQV